MSQSLTQIYLHIVFSTKRRAPFLKDRELRSRLHAYLVGACKNLACPPLQVGGVEDHVHILCRLAKTISVAELLHGLKRESSKWLKTQARALEDFYWQGGYGAFSVSASQVDGVKAYIETQEEHNRTMSFQDEFRLLCQKHGVEIDERYVWD